MFTIRWETQRVRPDITLTLRTEVDGWNRDIAGHYREDAWHFELDEDRYPNGAAFKFLLEGVWMLGDNLFLPPRGPDVDFVVADEQVAFPPLGERALHDAHRQSPEAISARPV